MAVTPTDLADLDDATLTAVALDRMAIGDVVYAILTRPGDRRTVMRDVHDHIERLTQDAMTEISARAARDPWEPA